MTHPNEDLMRTGYAAFAAQDIPTVLGIFHPDITWAEGNHNAVSGHYTGHDEVVAFFTKLFELTDGTFALAVQQVIADDTGAVVIVNATATRDGQALAWRAAHLWRIESGKATSFEDFVSDGQAIDAAFG